MDTVVGEMDMPVVDVLQGEIIRTEPYVAILIKPYFRGTEILNQNPLSDIEFFILYYKRMFYVLLHHKLPCPSTTIVNDVVEVVIAPNADAS